ncbi:MAG: urease accessory protein UreF [Rhodobacteraceae bacterium]|nr:urease accessory protein UreF [Paracoccaceae bacterium]
MDNTALLLMVRWLSPSYPTGAFAWSHGLEAAIDDRQVTDAASLEQWISGVLAHGAGRNDAILLQLACRAAPAELKTLATLAEALAPSKERRDEALLQGAAFATTTRAVKGYDLPDMALPVAVGRAAALAGLPAAQVAGLYLQSLASNLVQAALRLMPLGQTAGQTVLDRLSPLCATLAEQTAALGTDDLGGCAYAADIAAMRHEQMRGRVFRS